MSPYPVVVGEPDPVFRVLRAPGAWRRLLAGTVIGLLAGGAWVLATPPSYEATVGVELTEVAGAVDVSPTGPGASPVTVDTDAQLITSDAVVRAVAEANRQDPDAVRRSLAVTARPLTRLLEVSYTARTPSEALVSVAAAADAFLTERQRLVIDPVRDYLLAVSTRGMRGTGTEVVTEASQDDDRVNEARRRLALAQLLSLPGPGSVIEQPRVTADGTRGDVEVPLATGAAAGALAGLLVGLWGERRRGRIPPSPVRRPQLVGR